MYCRILFQKIEDKVVFSSLQNIDGGTFCKNCLQKYSVFDVGKSPQHASTSLIIKKTFLTRNGSEVVIPAQF